MGGTLAIVPIPIDDPIAKPHRPEFGKGPDPQEGHVTRPWTDYFTSSGQSMQAATQRVGVPAALTAQAANIGATDFGGGDLTTGLYVINWYSRITTVAGVSSSLTVTFDWQDGGVAVSFTPAAITGNTTNSFGSYALPIHIDSASPVRFSTVYASNPAGQMQYSIFIALQRIDA